MSQLFFRKESLEFRFCYLITILVILGFTDSFIGFVLIGPNRHSIHIVVHSFLMFGWLGLVLIQSHSISRGRKILHKRLGFFSIFFVSVLIVPYGVRATYEMWKFFSTNYPSNGLEIAKFVFNPILTLLGFTMSFYLGIIQRKKADLHSSFIIAASLMLVSPGLERLPIYQYNPFKWFGPSNFSNLVQTFMFLVFLGIKQNWKFPLSRRFWAFAFVVLVFLTRFGLQNNATAVQFLLDKLQ